MNRPIGDPVDILILGQAGAGKTALIQALLIVAQNRPESLGGTLAPASVAGSGVPRYQFAPNAASKLPVTLPVAFLEMNLPEEDAPRPPNGAAVGDADLGRADALILVVDAALPDERLRRAFDVAVRLIDRLQDCRQSSLPVGGFPVAVALTQCDLLADHLIGHTEWLADVEARQKHLKELFADVYKANGEGSFGSFALEIYPTATHLPDTSEKRKDRDEPFGVAVLFRELFEAAYDHAQRGRASARRLGTIMLSAVAALFVMAAGTAVLLLSRTDEVQLVLETKFDGYQSREGQTASTRLAENQLKRKRSELLELRNDSDFDRLPPDKQAALRRSLDEIEAYIRLKDDVARLTPPDKARSLEELARLEDSLKGTAVPKAYEQDWDQTEAVQTRKRYLGDIPDLRAAAAEARQHFGALKNRANALLFAGEILPEWESDARRLRQEAEAPPFAAGDRLKRASLNFREVDVLRGEWVRSLDRLRAVQDLAAALGIVGDATAGSAVLLLNDNDLQSGDPLHRIADRVAALKKLYPGSETWGLAQVPDNLRPQFQSRLARAITLSIAMGQRLLAGQMLALNPTGPERPADWPKLADWLLAPAQKDYRDFHQALHRILDPTAEDACEQFARFANARSFAVGPKSLMLFVPNAISEFLVRPAGKLTIRLKSAAGTATALSFRQDGDGRRDKNGVVYLFAADGTNATVNFVPGDALTADLPLKESEKAGQFSWTTSRTTTFLFERLLHPPRYHDPARPPTAGTEVDGVKLTATEGTLPGVPELLPTIRW